MERLNYQHLYYFWTIVKEGGIARACEKLHLAQPTISGQLAVFERAIGEKLFHRDHRKLVITDTGRAVFHYAEEIFALGQELKNVLKGQSSGKKLRLNIGTADALAKLITYRLIEPALRMAEPVHIVCYEDKAERLLAELALHGLDLVLSDMPAMPSKGEHTFNHLLGESSVAVFGIHELAVRYRPDFPQSLNNAPMLLPTSSTALRRSLDQWFDSEKLSPNILAEVEDSALLKTFARAGVGLFVAPVAVAAELRYQYNAEPVGRIDAVHERFYAISARRKLQHPAVVAILENAQRGLFDGLDLQANMHPSTNEP